MAIEEVFKCNNNYFTGVTKTVKHHDGTTTKINTKAIGICTAASLLWAKAVLKKGKAINSLDELPPPILMTAQMRIIRQNDHDPAKQTEIAGLEQISDHVVGNATQAAQGFGAASPSIGIFWNHWHTMGFRVGVHESEYFDIECGLYRSTSLAETTLKMKEVTQTYGSAIIGYRLVRLG